MDKIKYTFDYDWDRGQILKEIGGYTWDDCTYTYEISDKTTIEELRKVEKLGCGIRGMFYVAYLNFKYRKNG